LAAATALLWDHNCGALPVVDQENRPLGMITDRDICIAVGTRSQRAAEIAVVQVMTGKVFACEGDIEIHEALACMTQSHVRRLIITEQGRVNGILSIDDIILNVQWSDHKRVELSFLDVIRVLRKVTYPAPPK
jgi:predicted transcriptional regulator